MALDFKALEGRWTYFSHCQLLTVTTYCSYHMLAWLGDKARFEHWTQMTSLASSPFPQHIVSLTKTKYQATLSPWSGLKGLMEPCELPPEGKGKSNSAV
jgi:hypothetical protein